MAEHPAFTRNFESSILSGPTRVVMSVNRLVLVLNASYEPVTFCTARRAITLVMKGAAVEESSAYLIRTPRITVSVPSVVRLRTYHKVPRRRNQITTETHQIT